MPTIVPDHFIYGTPDLEGTVDELGRALGVPIMMGGRHPGWGTRNAILSLGSDLYLEVMAPDPDQPETAGKRLFDIDALEAPRMLTWAARPRAASIEEAMTAMAGSGFRPGPVGRGSRERPDGSILSWRLTDPFVVHADGVLPFLIEWGDSVHPGRADLGVSVETFALQHPDAEALNRRFEQLARLTMLRADSPGIVLSLSGPAGSVALTGAL